MEIRLVKKEDAKGILAIYAPYVENTTITFEYDVPLIEDFSKRIEDISDSMPYFVAIENNTIIGYCYATKYRARAAYQWAVELSIYIDKAYARKQIGTILYTVLLDTLKKLGYHQAYACITMPNTSSINFHKKFNFKEIGIFHQCGYKYNQWLDTLWMEYKLQEYNEQVQSPISIKELDMLDKVINTQY